MAITVTLTCHNVTLYVHYLSCLKLHKSVTICTVLLLLTSGIVSSYSLSGQGYTYVCVAPRTLEALQWAESVSRDFSELSKQDSSVGKPGTPELHWPLALYKKKSVLDFRLYNKRWGMQLSNKMHVRLYSCIGKKKYTACCISGITFSSAVMSTVSRRERQRRERN
jgi:hypothetical protein